MSNRQDKEREARLQPLAIDYCKKQITALGYEIIYEDAIKIKFMFNGSEVTHFAYSGWHSGKSIKDGRGIEKLLKQLKNDR